MSSTSSAPAVSDRLRLSLKRGLARQAFTQADTQSANMVRLINMVLTLRPNRKALERLGARLVRMSGVVRVRLAPDARGITLIARCSRRVVTCAEGVEVFQEEGLLYFRVKAALETGQVVLGFTALGYCLHALERLVERTDLPLDTPILPALDAEACAVFGQLDADAMIEDGADQFVRALKPGVWAASPDRMALDPDWGLCSRADVGILMISMRTFLGPDEMRPTLWLRWRADPACKIALAA